MIDAGGVELPSLEIDTSNTRQVNRGGKLLDRRTFLIKARNIIGGVVVAPTLVGQTVAEVFGLTGPIEFAVDGGETEKFFTTVPERRQTPLSSQETDFDMSDKASHLLWSFGDSLAAGYVEGVEWSGSSPVSTVALFSDQAKALDPFAKNDVPNKEQWRDNQTNSWPGSTSSETIKKVREVIAHYKWAHQTTERLRSRGDQELSIASWSYDKGLLSDLEWDISMGGNDLIHLFLGHMPELAAARALPDRLRLDYHSFVGLRQAAEVYLPKFQTAYTQILEEILSEAIKPDSSLKNLKQIFVRGLPDGFKIDHLDLSQVRNDIFKKMGSRQLTPAEQEALGVLTIHMNNAIVTAIEDAVRSVSERNPGAKIPKVLFESLDGVELKGIHPSERGYKQIEIGRLQRCYADFPAVTDGSGKVILEGGKRSFWEQAELTNNIIPQLKIV